MTDEGLDRLIARARASSEGAGPAEAESCLSLVAARRIALDPAQLRPDEAVHLDACSACSRLIGQILDSAPHPSFGVLLGGTLGLLSGASARAFTNHAASGACKLCRERLTKALPTVSRCTSPVLLPEPGAATAEPAAAEAFKSTSDEQIGFSVVMEGGRVVLEVRSRDPRMAFALVNYSLFGRDPNRIVEDFALLRPDVRDWQVAEIAVDDRVTTELGGEMREVVVAMAHPATLTQGERSLLMARADRDPAWKEWLNRNTTVRMSPAEARPLRARHLEHSAN